MRSDKILVHSDWQDAPLAVFVLRFWQAQHRAGTPETGLAAGPVVKAFISEGRWVAECPSGSDKGALCVDHADPRFMCTRCWNVDAGGLWLPVEFPPDRVAIERVLVQRPARDGWTATHRNWLVGETLEDLREENRLRGLS